MDSTTQGTQDGTTTGTPGVAPVQFVPDPGLERDLFLRTLVRELAGTLEETVGLEDAAGYISIVGRRMGAWLDESYREALGVDRLDRDQVAAVHVDLKARIQGDFVLQDSGQERLEYTNSRCPFEEKVLGRESMCMMTSNVFGLIAAENLGYAKVELAETIARGDGRCRVVVHLEPRSGQHAAGREYFGE
ncbi:methanogen output domain 1-containing protein [Nocardioides sp.]|uniref:methanogen output domain 1-containing protein n=1 Tax=Nocardioides sp. TaxID=35761 RepID=UPI00261053D9|nr:methanogen output domain 1-containing protein [Nocardioides sp.]